MSKFVKLEDQNAQELTELGKQKDGSTTAERGYMQAVMNETTCMSIDRSRCTLHMLYCSCSQ